MRRPVDRRAVFHVFFVQGAIGPMGPKGSEVRMSGVFAVVLKTAVSDLSHLPWSSVTRAIPERSAILESKETRYEEPRPISIVTVHQDSRFEVLKQTFLNFFFRGPLVSQEIKERYEETVHNVFLPASAFVGVFSTFARIFNSM